MNIDFASLSFYFFSATLIFMSLYVVFSSNTLYSVLALIGAFVSASVLFLLVNAEFIALTLVIVYVGAVAVFFLFVVMMLLPDEKQILNQIKFYIIPLIGGSLVMVGIYLYVKNWTSSLEALSLVSIPLSSLKNMFNIKSIGNVLYTYYFLPFQMLGLVLLIAMIGTILLTLKERTITKTQKIKDQINRFRKESLTLHDIPLYSGVKNDDEY